MAAQFEDEGLHAEDDVLATNVSFLRVAVTPAQITPWEEVCGKLNRLLKGWSGYFDHGTLTPAYRAVDNHVLTRAQRFLVQRHKVPSRGTVRFSRKIVFGELGVLSSRTRQTVRRPMWALQ